MKVVILCGGLGTRLREETEFRPKPMVPVGNRPILWHIMKFYASFGFKEFILCLGYKSEVIKEYFFHYQWHCSDVTLKLGPAPQITYHTQHSEEDWQVTLLDTGLNTQTGGRVRRALAHIPDDEFLLTYGDGLCNVPVPELIKFHRAQGGLATLRRAQHLRRRHHQLPRKAGQRSRLRQRRLLRREQKDRRLPHRR
jgi:glucose-1-phosphate cytidylyltransferase